MKRLLEKYLLKKIRHNNREYKRYLFLRWLAEFVKKDDMETSSVMCGIAAYIFEKYQRLADKFSDVFIVGNKVFIVTTRPGMWIGKGGETINAIEKTLNVNRDGKKVSNYEIELIEDVKSAVPDIHGYFKVLGEY